MRKHIQQTDRHLLEASATGAILSIEFDISTRLEGSVGGEGRYSGEEGRCEDKLHGDWCWLCNREYRRSVNKEAGEKEET